MADLSSLSRATSPAFRPLAERDYGTFFTIVTNAYPGFNLGTAEDRERFMHTLTERVAAAPMSYVGIYRDDTLLGGARLLDFVMNVRNAEIAAAGIGMVAVDLAHKKEHVARDLMYDWLRYCRSRGVPFALLYPFRPDFYKQMGFGYGTKLSQYHVPPIALPDRGDKSRVSLIGADEQQLIGDCYARVVARTNGLIHKSDAELSGMFTDPTRRIVGYRDKGKGNVVRGYLVFSFKDAAPNQFLTYDLNVHEMAYETREALLGLLAFLRSQSDQVNRIEFNTQDDNFHLLLSDVRDGSNVLLPSVYHQSNVQGVGIMYRVVDVRRAFELLRAVNFGGESLTLRINVSDSFLPENESHVTVRFSKGRPDIEQAASPDVGITLDIAEFSSLLMGAADFRSLYRYGLADISETARVEQVNRLFATSEKPICMTHF
ncbi:MAG TPA: GNAT family N-acetyltransferase [Ktedonobacterales bacterium]|nr:GNAT family N-acetyltransferase [Ktedonobacterales bacterium]